MMTEQGTAEWLKERCGKVTASRIADLMARTKTGWGASRANYAAQIELEILLDRVAPTFCNDAMRWGTETEPEARRAYEFFADCDVQQVGFIPHPTIARAGASPDGMVGEDGLVEIKCMMSANHRDILLSQTIPDKYIKQMQFQMACTDRQWCDFAAYDPRFPERMRLWVRRVERDDEAIQEIEDAVCQFIAEVEANVGKLRAQYEPQLEEAA